MEIDEGGRGGGAFGGGNIGGGGGRVIDLSPTAEGTAEAANIGESYGKFGTVVENPKIAVKGFVDGHPVNQAITRGVSPQAILNTMRNPIAVLSQRGGTRFAYVSNDAVVIVNKAGNIVTTWGKSNFDKTVLQVLEDAKK